ncbi:MAG: hypothetical protein FJ272_16645, partial [Planctomycetes bacterium]|nr:hypothetical protein [Planctomycetota bacterium]
MVRSDRQQEEIGSALKALLDGERADHEGLAKLASLALHDPTQTDFFRIRRENVERELAERLRWFRRAAPLFKDGFLTLASQRTPVQIPHEQLWSYYVPLARWLMAQPHGRQGRFLVAIAGIPGSGKSLMAEILRVILTPMLAVEHGAGRVDVLECSLQDARVCGLQQAEACTPAGKSVPLGRAAVVGLDGWHFPNAHLLSHFVKDETGNDVPLKTFKGAEFTFDAAKAKAAFAALKQQPTATLSLPVYDRQKHDPVDDAVRITPDDRLVLIEGNYLLLDKGDWAGMADLFDLKVFIDLAATASAAQK